VVSTASWRDRGRRGGD